MKRFALFAAVVALSACAKKDEAAVVDSSTAMAPAMAPAADPVADSMAKADSVRKADSARVADSIAKGGK